MVIRFRTLMLAGLLASGWRGPALCAVRGETLPPAGNYKTVLEQPYAKVIRVHYGPHEKVAVHDHPATATVYVYLNDAGPVRFVHEEGGAFAVVRPPTHKGAFRVNKGRIERHSVENLGDVESDFLRVELPGVELGQADMQARGAAPADLAHALAATEFEVPGLSILRTICVGPQSCTIAGAKDPSVIVAFSPTTTVVRRAGREERATLQAGDVMALRPGEELMVAPAGQEAAHVLQLRIGAAAPAAR